MEPNAPQFDPVDIETLSIFNDDSPDPEAVGSPSLLQFNDADSSTRAAALTSAASAPAEMVNPAEALGPETWEKMQIADLAARGANARANFNSRWNWEMPRSVKAKMLADQAFQAVMRPLATEISDFITSSQLEKMNVSPDDVIMKRIMRRG